MGSRSPAEGRLSTQHAAALALAESASLSDATPRILKAICQSLGWAHGALWEVTPDGSELRCVETWDEDGLDLAKFTTLSPAATKHASGP